MKTATKLKIINFVKRILKYENPQYIEIKSETRSVIDLKVSHICYQFEWEHKELMYKDIASEFANELVKLQLIKVEEVEMNQHRYGNLTECHKVEARLSIVK